jgi:hypothetical protein
MDRFSVLVDAEALELVLARLDNADFEELLDPSDSSDINTLRAKIKLSNQLMKFADANPSFDERDMVEAG